MIEKAGELKIAETFPASSERNIINVAKGGGVTFAGKLFLAGSRFAIAVLLARLLGAEQYGLYNVAISAGALATGLALLGLHSALVRFVAVLASRRDDAGVWGALQVGIGLSLLLSVLTSVGLYALSFTLADQVFHEPGLAPLLQLISLFVPSFVLSDILAGAIRGFKRMQYPVLAQFVAQPLIRLVLVVALAFSGLNATLAVVIYGVADLAATGMLVYFLHKQFSLWRPLRAARWDVRGILSYSLPDWLADLMVKFQGNVQTLLLGALNRIADVGIFSVAHHLHDVGRMFYSSINTSARPLIAELHDRGDREQMGQIYQTATKWALTLNLPVFLAMVLYPAPILAVFGESFVSGATALVILAWTNLVVVGTGMCGAIVEMTGYMKLKLMNSLVRLVLLVGLNVLLIPRWGLVGAATAALVGEAVINLLRLAEVFILFRLLPYNRSFLKPIVAGLVALAAVGLLSQWLPATTTLHLLLHLPFLLAVYAGATLALGLSPQERMMLARLRRRTRSLISRG